MARHQRLPPRRRREVFRTYFVDSRGDEALGSTWSYLDITALGRQEIWEDSPEGYPQTQAYAWWNRHDEYDEPTVFQAALDAAGRRAARRGEHLMATAEALYIERTYDAPAEAVFDAWTNEEVLRRWFHAQRDWTTPEATVDLRVGGAVRVVMHDPVRGREPRRRRSLHRGRPPHPPRLHLDLGPATTARP